MSDQPTATRFAFDTIKRLQAEIERLRSLLAEIDAALGAAPDASSDALRHDSQLSQNEARVAIREARGGPANPPMRFGAQGVAARERSSDA